MTNRTWPGAVDAYISSLVSAGRSPGTIRVQRHYLRHIQGCAPCPHMVSPEALDHRLAVPTWAPETRHSARTVARGFFGWALERGIIPDDPSASLLPVTVPPPFARPAPDAAVKQALVTASPREALMIRFAAFCGMRCAEIAQVHARDWDGAFLIVHGKGGKRRRVPVLDPVLKMTLNTATGYVFEGRTNGHLSAARVTRLLSVSLPPGVTGHMLRHRFATTAYAQTRDLLSLSAILGHAKPETTKRYVQLPQDALIAVMASAGRDSLLA